MLNLAAIRGSNGRIASYGYQWSNGGIASGSSTSQISALGARPLIFWDGRRNDYGAYGSAGSFTNQDNANLFSVWRLTDGFDIVADIAEGSIGAEVLLNRDITWDDQLFAVNGQGKGNTANGSPLSKLVVPADFFDFSTSRPLLMSLTGGLPRNGGDVVSKSEPGDAWWRAGNPDYYLNYYPKYDGTSKKLLAKDDGYDWYGLNIRPQIDGTKPVTQLAAEASSFATGYSKVGEIAYI